MKKIIVLVLGLFFLFEINLSAQTLTKHPDDKSVSRNFVLENGLKVLVVSDPKFNVSAASLEVQVGSLMDPKDRQGLAHFLEHMLFLGTQKFPEVEEFPQYLERHGGYSNAYTAEDHSNYHLEIQHDSFEGALDRFSHFFIDPLFSSEYIQREINAVHSEHQKNLEQDGWRQMQLFRSFYREDHPANHFATGNEETLEGVTREEFINFYNSYYSANRMSLVLLSNKGLDDLEAMARKYFQPVKNNNLKALTYDPYYLDPVEPYYGTKYSYTIENGNFYNSLLNPPLIGELSLPASNSFLPDNISLLAERPVNLINEPGLELWYAQDRTFKMPKVSIMFRLQNPKDQVDPGYMTRLYLYTECIDESLNEIAYPARVAGLYYDISADYEGLTILISGYSTSSRKLLMEIGRRLKTFDMTDQQFSDIKDRKLREWKNFKMGEAWDIASMISRTIQRETYYNPDTLVKEANLLTLADIKRFSDTFLKKTRIDGLVYGNVTAEEAISLSRLLQSYRAYAPLNRKDAFKQRILVEKAKDPLTYIKRLETNNSCLWKSIHLGSDKPDLRMTIRILEKFISPLFYTQMRTQEQLGYIVWTAASEDNGQYYLIFVVQSESHPADQIRQKADLFMKGLPDEFEKLSDEEFAEYKAAVRDELLEKPKSINENRVLLQTITFYYEKDFDRLQNSLDALDALTRAQVARLLSDIVIPETRKVTDILLFAKEHTMMDDTKASFDSIEIFKKGREFVARPKRQE